MAQIWMAGVLKKKKKGNETRGAFHNTILAQ